MIWNSSPAMCEPCPTPAEAKVSLPGCDLASAISSFTEFAGRLGVTTRISGSVAIIVTGAKSLIVS